MDIQKIRFDNMMILKGDQSIADLANRIESVPNYFYQLKREGGRAMGTSIARRLEAAYGKPKGWMDTQHTNEDGQIMEEAAPYTSIVELARSQPFDLALLEDCIAALESALEEPGEVAISPRQKASMIAGLYVSRLSNSGASRPGDVATAIAAVVAGAAG